MVNLRGSIGNTWVFFLLILIMLSSATQAYADVHVKGYYRKDGTYVRPHYRSNPDGNFFNNWSTYGNINPYTGKEGTKHYPESNFSPYTYKSFSYWSNENSYDNSNFSINNNNDHNLIVNPSLEQSEVTDTTSLDSSQNINIAESYINSYDTTKEIAAKTMLVKYFNDINTRAYISAYDCWVTNWQNKHPYDSFEEGYVDVINNIDKLNSFSTDNGIALEGTITTIEGWEETFHQYHFGYTVKKIDGTWKLTKGKLKKLW